MNDRDCFNCNGFGDYGCRTCRFCFGSGRSSKLKAIFDRSTILAFAALAAFALAAFAFGKAFHGLG